MLATAKEETHISPGLEFIPNSYQADPSFSGKIALELPDDNNGNLTQKTNKTTSAFTLYEYDAENKLIRVVREDGSIVNYKYDGLGRRIEKEVDSVVTQYIYDDEDILLELDGSNNITARYTHGPGIDEPLIVEKSGVSSFYHADGLGSITELTDSIGTVAQAYTYSSFGKIESQLDPNFVQPYTFTAREFDMETGLYYYRARAYDSSMGRFLQKDPLSVINLPQSLNKYPYVRNNPANFVDPLGLLGVGELLQHPVTGGIIGALVERIIEQIKVDICPGVKKAILDLTQGVVAGSSAALFTATAVGTGLAAVTIAATPVAVVVGLTTAAGLAVVAGIEAARSAANIQQALDFFGGHTAPSNGFSPAGVSRLRPMKR